MNVLTIEKKISAKDALDILNDSWSYYSPEPLPQSGQERKEPELFQYHNAA
jgi:hypothetical protein